MSTFDFGSETKLQEWARREFDLTYSAFCALVALVAGHRINGGAPILQSEAAALIWTYEEKGGAHPFPLLERAGLITRGRNGGESGNSHTWTPTARGITRVLGAMVPPLSIVEELKSGPRVAKAPSESVLVEQRAAG